MHVEMLTSRVPHIGNWARDAIEQVYLRIYSVSSSILMHHRKGFEIVPSNPRG